jgi:hypothetical protein
VEPVARADDGRRMARVDQALVNEPVSVGFRGDPGVLVTSAATQRERHRLQRRGAASDPVGVHVDAGLRSCSLAEEPVVVGSVECHLQAASTVLVGHHLAKGRILAILRSEERGGRWRTAREALEGRCHDVGLPKCRADA